MHGYVLGNRVTRGAEVGRGGIVKGNGIWAMGSDAGSLLVLLLWRAPGDSIKHESRKPP